MASRRPRSRPAPGRRQRRHRLGAGDPRAVAGRSASGARRARRARRRRGRVRQASPGRLRHELDQRPQREPDVADDRLPDRRPRGVDRIRRDRDQRRPLGQQRPRQVRVVGEHRRADDEHQIVAIERLRQRPDRRRQHPRELRVVLREPEPRAAGRRRRPNRQPLLDGQFDGRVPRAGRVDLRSGDEHRGTGVGESSCQLDERGRIGRGAAAHPPARGLQRPVGIGLLPPVVHRDRDERRSAWWQRGGVDRAGQRGRDVLRAAPARGCT